MIYLGANMAVSVVNLGYNLVFSRKLGPADYSALGALLGAIGVLSVPLDAVQLSFAQAQARGDSSSGLRRSLSLVLVYATSIALLLAAAQRPMESYLHLRGFTPLAFSIGWLATATVSAVPMGVLLGQRRFGILAVAAFTGTGASRLLLGLVFARAGWGLDGALAATLAGQALTLVIAVTAVRHRLRSRPRQLIVKRSDALRSVGALIGIAALASVDTTLARHFLASREAGYYTAAATASRIALFASGNITLIAFPRFVAAHAAGRVDTQTLWRAALGVGGLGIVAAAILISARGLVVRLLFGSQYTASGLLLGWLAAAGALMGLVSLMSHFLLAYRSRWAATSWIGAVAMIVTTELFPQTIGHLTPLGLCYIVVAAVGTSLLLAAGQTRRLSLRLLQTPPDAGLIADVMSRDRRTG